MLSSIVTNRLAIIVDTSKNCNNFSIHPKFCDLEDCTLFVTKVLLNLDRFYSIMATMRCFKLCKSTIMDQFVIVRERIYRTEVSVVECKPFSVLLNFCFTNELCFLAVEDDRFGVKILR